MARQRRRSTHQSLVTAFDALSASDRRKFMTVLARRPRAARTMARVALAKISDAEAVDLWQKLSAEITRARPASSALARVVRGTLINYHRLAHISNQRERERLARRPGRKWGARTTALACKALPLLEPGRSHAEVGQLSHA